MSEALALTVAATGLLPPVLATCTGHKAGPQANSTHHSNLISVQRATWTLLLLLLLARNANLASVLPKLPHGLAAGTLSKQYCPGACGMTNTRASRTELPGSCTRSSKRRLHFVVRQLQVTEDRSLWCTACKVLCAAGWSRLMECSSVTRNSRSIPWSEVQLPSRIRCCCFRCRLLAASQHFCHPVNHVCTKTDPWTKTVKTVESTLLQGSQHGA